jgi:NCS1 family nucleobase:cation symporter-1
MNPSDEHPNVLDRLDQLNEFEREPVTPDKLHGGGYFAAVYSGEHIAATEFVIGALFVSFGARAADVVVGLLVGNLLAVLSWTLLCAPIAVQTRLTLYWYLRRIAGPGVTFAYNVLNGVLHCILAGAMITVSASAVRIPLGIAAETRWFPTHASYVLMVVGVGAVVVTLAIWGFKRLAQFASICSPWMVAMFIAGGLAGLPMLGSVHSLDDFWLIAQRDIWAGPTGGQSGLGFWHVVAFAWICNLATHVGLSDMALFRFARRPWYGLYSAFGMYLGHYLSWVCAGIMGAAAAKTLQQPLVELDSGSIGFTALGAVGALTVLIAGWTTANPTLYRAGLALQVATPGWPRWLVTLTAGALTTVVACFPFVFTKLLDFVGIYGLLLMPVGAIVVVEHWLFPRIGWTRYWFARTGRLMSWPALAAWGLSLAVAFAVWQMGLVHLFFLAAPTWLLTAVLYTLLAGLAGARQPAATSDPIDVATRSPSPSIAPPSSVPWPLGRKIAFTIAALSLVACVTLALLAFLGRLPPSTLRSALVGLTALYFVAAFLSTDRQTASLES